VSSSLPVDLEIAQVIVALLRETLGVDVPSVDTDLIASAILDSLGLVELIGAVEERFGVELPLDEIELEQLSTPARLSELVREQGGQA
jgi:acyl carrier protein